MPDHPSGSPTPPERPNGIATRHRACPLCGTDNRDAAADALSRDPWWLKTCRSCGFLYLENAPDYAALSETLAWDKTFREETQRRLKQRPLSKKAFRKARGALLPRRRDMDHFARIHFRPGNILDVGCGEGVLLTRLTDQFVPFGIEIGKEAAARADALLAEHGGGCVHAPALAGLNAFEDGFFTGIILRSFLEHEVSPGPVLAELRRVLAPDGGVLVKVPNFASLNRRVMGAKWCGFRFPDHVNYFTPASLGRLARDHGFSCRLIWSKSLPVSDNMTALLRPLTPPSE